MSRIFENTRRGILVSAMLAGLPAAAKDVVIYQGESSSLAISRVVMATKTDISNLEAVDLQSLLEAEVPALVGPGSIAPCSAETSTLEAIRTAVEQAKADLDFMDYEAAKVSFDLAKTAVPCLGEKVDTALIAQLHFLEGIAHLGQADKPSAWESFRQARLYSPDLVWDESFAPEGKPTFLAAVAEMEATAPQALYFIPQPAEGHVIIDGEAIPAGTTRVELHQGTHLLQWNGETLQSAQLKIVAGPSPVLVSSQDIPGDLLAWAKGSDKEKHAAIRATLGGLESSTGEIYISSPHGIWQTQLGLDSWTQIEGTPTEEELLSAATTQQPRGSALKTVGASMLGTGTALAIAAGWFSYKGYVVAKDAYDSMVDTSDAEPVWRDIDGPEMETQTQTYNDGKTDRDRGLVWASVGAVVATAGVVIRHNSLSLSPTMGPAGSVGMRLEFKPVQRTAQAFEDSK